MRRPSRGRNASARSRRTVIGTGSAQSCQVGARVWGMANWSVRSWRFTSERPAYSGLRKQAADGLCFDQLTGLVEVIVDNRLRVNPDGMVDRSQ